ncbi:DUF6919 domain-containing protein [Kitasatospora cathayae]|uniref:DUF6919 domain-containing protein n=1 Tax=Kitasatospora cathayae TaxID=3004092 RepID=A0ABY7QI78_9ACTN|nr:hypothetical protein [Kitasatospora sp. HUAS 3-15]WBP92201.1 hypothetical protein O1G21_41065 [Kitasatospora sp. HUAS 3-15]
MPFRDRRRWRAARTAADLGELTAQWLEGSLSYHPAVGRTGPDTETTGNPQLLAALLLANRSGYITQFSQPGDYDLGADGVWSQIATVSGFVTDPDVLNRLRGAAGEWGLQIREYRSTYLGPLPEPIVVTDRPGSLHTLAGRALTGREVRRTWHGASRTAVRAMERAWQVTLAEAGYSSGGLLWRALTDALGEPAACEQWACTPYEPCREDGCWLTTHGAETLCRACAYGNPGFDAPDDYDDQDHDFEDFSGEPEESECDLCGAPFYGSRRYCTEACEEADAPEPGHPADIGAETDVEHFTVLAEDPWTTAPRT